MTNIVSARGEWIAALQALAERGLRWAGDDPYQRSRFERAKRVADELAGAEYGISGQPWGDILQAIANEGSYWSGDDAAAQPVVTNETTDAGWFAEDALPSLHPGHAVRIADAFRFQRGELKQTVWH